jgi:putative membrane protein
MNRARWNPIWKILAAGLFLFISVPAQAATLSDEDIVAIIAVANVNEINASKLAKSNAYQDKVRQFAEKMIKDHREMDQQAGKLAVKLRLNPTPTDLGESLKAQGTEVMEGLKIAPKGPIFDKEYMSTQVQMHEQVLNLFNNELIPNAKNEQLKALLQKSTKDIESHLQDARQLHEEITANI